jgi:HEPN domain-containing protein
MKDETSLWLNYADENLESSLVLLHSHLYNPCLQNTQQAIEKYLKAIFIEFGIKLQKTHNIASLTTILQKKSIVISINLDEIELIDAIYLTSKYPFGSVLADFNPDEKICQQCIQIAKKVQLTSLKILNNE